MQKTYEDVQTIINRISYPDGWFVLLPKGDGFLLQMHYVEDDVMTDDTDQIQSTRKWYISSWATESEIVQTALKCVITSMEHRAREHFTYKGLRIFHPHHDIQDLCDLADKAHYRAPKE